MPSERCDQVLDLRNLEAYVPEISSASGGRVESNLAMVHPESRGKIDKNKIQNFILTEM